MHITAKLFCINIEINQSYYILLAQVALKVKKNKNCFTLTNTKSLLFLFQNLLRLMSILHTLQIMNNSIQHFLNILLLKHFQIHQIQHSLVLPKFNTLQYSRNSTVSSTPEIRHSLVLQKFNTFQFSRNSTVSSTPNIQHSQLKLEAIRVQQPKILLIT